MDRRDYPDQKTTFITNFLHTHLMSSLTPSVLGSITSGSLRPSPTSGSLMVSTSRLEGGANEGTGVTILLQDFGKVELFLLQAALPGHDAPRSVVQTPDQHSLDMGWMVELKVQVSVCVWGLTVDGDIQAAIISPLEQAAC